MSGRDDEFDWDDIRAGHLDEGEHEDPLGLKNGRGSRAPGYALRIRARPSGRRVATVASPTGSGAPAAKLGKASARQGLAPFHFAHSFVSRPRGWSSPRAVTKGTRKIVYPSKSDVALLRAVPEARYHNRHHCWTLPRGHAFLQSGPGLGMNGVVKAAINRHRRDGQGVMKAPNAGGRFQDYIERATRGEARRAEEVEHDRDGPISVGNLGETRAERQEFWGAVERAERRSDARVQCRIIAELPHWLSPEARRRIVEALGAEIGARGLGWWAAAHRPDVAKGSDPRNFHLHVGYHDRPVEAREISFVPDPAGGPPSVVRGGPVFAERKDREAQGEAWVVALKRRFAEIVNAAIAEHEAATGRPAPFRYFPGSYEELGIRAEGQRHLGPKRTALERAGILTHNGGINIERAQRADGIEFERCRRALMLALRQDALWNFAGDGSALARLHKRLADMIEADIGPCAERLAEAIETEAAAILPMGDAMARDAIDAILARRASSGLPPPSGTTRVERRAAELATLATRAAGDAAALAEIAERQAELAAAEGGLEPAEAGPRRRLLEEALDDARKRFVDRTGLLAVYVEAAAAARLAASFASTLAAWQAWAARRTRPAPGEALPDPPAIAGDHAWSRRSRAAPLPPEEAARDETWKRVRRRLEEDELQARQFARHFAGNAGLDAALVEDCGVALAGLGDAFAALRDGALARFEIRERGLER